MLALATRRLVSRIGRRALLLVLVSMVIACRSASTDRATSPSESATAVTATDASTPSRSDAGAAQPEDGGGEPDGAALARLGFICVPPLSGDFERCPKGAMAGDDALRDCLRREAEGQPKKPTFRIGSAPSSAFSPTRWRCVGVPLDTKTHVTIDTLAGLDETVPSACASHAIDMIGPNQYGAIFFRCSHRARSSDEILPSDSGADH